MDVAARLAEMGLTLPEPPKPVAAYVPSVSAAGLVFISGQLPMAQGKLLATGPVASAQSVEDAQIAARQCALNALAVLGAEIGWDWDRLVRLVRIGAYVASDPGFTDQPLVANGASLFLGEVFGDAGRHARAAVGAAALPLGATVEVDMIAAVKD